MMPDTVDPYDLYPDPDWSGTSTETDDEGDDICHEDTSKEVESGDE